MASSIVMFSTFAEFKIEKEICAGLKKTKGRCQLRPKSLAQVEPFLDEIANNISTSKSTFERLANLVFCHHHVRHASQAGEYWHKEWESSDGKAPQKKCSPPKSSFQEFQERAGPYESESEYESDSFSAYEPEMDDEDTLFETENPQSMYTLLKPGISNDCVANRISEILAEKPNDRTKALGTIYAIAVLDEPGLYKVGVTTNEAEAREQHHKKCYGEIQMANTSLTAWAPRIERLVHAELDMVHYAQIEKCHICDTSHRELFKASIKDIRDATEKWTRFFIQNPNPYNREGKLKDDVELPSPAFRRQSPNSTPSKKGSDEAQSATRRSLPSCEDSSVSKDPSTPTKQKSSRRSGGNIYNFNLYTFAGFFQNLTISPGSQSDRS